MRKAVITITPDEENQLDCQTGEKLIQSIDGQFAYDINDDCMVDAAEIVDAANHNWRGWNVSATQGGQFYLSGYPFSDGSFNLKLFEGDNEVRIIPPSLYHEVCEPVLTINPADLTEENFLEPLIKVKEECAFLEVNLTSRALRVWDLALNLEHLFIDIKAILI